MKAELLKKPEDISRKSDYKLNQIIELCNLVLENKEERVYFMKALNIDEKNLINVLNLLRQRVQASLNQNMQAEMPKTQVQKTK